MNHLDSAAEIAREAEELFADKFFSDETARDTTRRAQMHALIAIAKRLERIATELERLAENTPTCQ